MAGGGFSAGLAGLSAAYPAYVQGQSDQYDLKNKALDMAAANALSQVLGGTSLGMPSPQPPPPGQASQPEPQAPPPPMQQGGQPPPPGPPVSQAPGRMPFMGGQVPQFGGPPGQVNPGPPQQMPQMPPTQAPSPGGLPVGGIGRGPSPMGPQGFGPQAAAPQPQGQPPMSPGMGAGARPPGGAAPPGGQQGPQGALTLQSFTQRWQQAAQKDPQLNQPGLFMHALKQVAPILQIADREYLMNVREQQLQQREQQLTQTLGIRSEALSEKIRHDTAEEGLRATGQKATEDARNTRNELAQERLVNQDQTVKALGGAEAKLQNQEAIITSFEDAEKKNLAKLVELGEKKGNSNIPVVERWRSWIAGKTPNDADINEFNLQYQLTAPGVARIISTANAAGVVSNKSREEFERGFSQFQTQKSLKQSVNRIFADFDNRKGSLGRELSEVRSQIDTRKKALGSKNVPDRAPAPMPQPSGGTPQGLPPGWSFKVE